MSQVISNPTGDGSQEVRLYQRGNDYIDLDAYIRQAEVGFEDWLSRINIKDKYKDKVRAAYQTIINKINDDPQSFTAKLGGGFTNTANITNETSGFDSYGIAAWYLGHTLRNMRPYSKPTTATVPSAPTKAVYDRDKPLFSSDEQSLIWGNNPESFIMLDNDSYNEATGKRGTTNRVSHIISRLEKYRDNLRNYRDFNNSEDDYNHAVGRINSAIDILKNNNPNDDWFTLEQLGLTDVGKYFVTGNEKKTSPRTEEEQNLYNKQARIRNFENYMAANRPLFRGTLKNVQVGNQVGTASDAEKQDLYTRMGTLSSYDIKDLILQYIENPNYSFSSSSYFLKAFGNQVPLSGKFTSAQYVTGLIKRASEIPGLVVSIPNSNLYYLPFTYQQYDDKSSTVWVYDSQNQLLKQMDTQDIEDYRKKYMEEFLSSDPQVREQYATNEWNSRYGSYGIYKEGGILKAQTGLEVPEINVYDPIEEMRKRNIDRFSRKVRRYEDNKIKQWIKLNYGNFQLDSKLPGWEDSDHSQRTNNIGNEPQTPTIERAYQMQRNYVRSGNVVKDVRTAYQNWLQSSPSGSYEDFANYYNNKVQKVRDLSRTKFSEGYGSTNFQPLYDDYNWLYSSSAATYDPEKGLLGSEDKNNLNSILGQTMFNRNPLAFLGDEDSTNYRLGTFIDNDPTGIQFWVNNEGKLELREPQKNYIKQDIQKMSEVNIEETGSEEPKSESKLTIYDIYPDGIDEPTDGGEFNEVTGDTTPYYVGGKKPKDVKQDLKEKTPGTKTSNTSSFNLIDHIIPNLIGAGRLFGSLHSNNNIAKVINKSLIPRLHNTYELYSPITGAFSEMQLRNKQGSNILSQSYKPFTSDANLAAARMLEGQTMANDLQYQGFLADDKEIKRTSVEALKRQEDNMRRRSDLANDNIDETVKTIQTKAQLEASRQKQNWQSVDNYLKGVEGRVKEDFDYNKALQRRLNLQDMEDRKKYETLQDEAYNQNKYKEELDTIEQLISNWEAKNPTLDYTRQPWYRQVQERRSNIYDRLKEDNIESIYKRRGWGSYQNPYKNPGKYYDPQEYDWNKIIVNRYGGTLIPRYRIKFKNQ